MTRVFKMQNISKVMIPVELKDGTTVYLNPRQVLEDVEVANYSSIARFLKADIVLNEPVEAVGPTKVSVSGKRTKQYLKG